MTSVVSVKLWSEVPLSKKKLRCMLLLTEGYPRPKSYKGLRLLCARGEVTVDGREEQGRFDAERDLTLSQALKSTQLHHRR